LAQAIAAHAQHVSLAACVEMQLRRVLSTVDGPQRG